MNVSYVRLPMGKYLPGLIRTLLMPKNNVAPSGTIAKPLSYAVANSCRNANAAVVNGLNVSKKMLWNTEVPLLIVVKLPINHHLYCTGKLPDPLPPSPNQSSSISSNFPDKKLLEKKFFRVVAFVWDNGGSFLGWSSSIFRSYIIEMPSVQFYWKRFHEKMKESKGNEI